MTQARPAGQARPAVDLHEQTSSPSRGWSTGLLYAARRLTFSLVGVASAIGVWQLIAGSMNNEARVPSVRSVWTFLLHQTASTPGLSYAGIPGSLWSNTGFTVEHTLEGFVLGTVVGYVTGLLLAGRHPVAMVANSLLVLYASVPAVILTPFVVLWFGPNGASELAIVAFYVFVLVAIAAQNSATHLSGRYTSFAASLGATRKHRLTQLLLPGCLPAALAVSRIALAVAWGLEVATELFGSNQGAGRVIQYYQQTGNPTGIIAGVLLLAMVALAVELVLRTLSRVATRWQENTDGGSL